jgi:hypothetical protein
MLLFFFLNYFLNILCNHVFIFNHFKIKKKYNKDKVFNCL